MGSVTLGCSILYVLFCVVGYFKVDKDGDLRLWSDWVIFDDLGIFLSVFAYIGFPGIMIHKMIAGRKMNRNQLKYLLVVAMIIDHIAWSFVPFYSVLGQGMHIVGRLTGPGMALLLAEGYQYTKDKRKYATRLFLFAMISWIPYSLHSCHRWPYFTMTMFGMIFTLFMAFVTIWMWDCLQTATWIKIMLVVVGIALSMLGDWPGLAVLWALFAYIYRENPKKKWISFVMIEVINVVGTICMSGSIKHGLFQLGALLVPIVFIFCYNGEPGSKAKFHKWFFYIFYPLHILILYLIEMM